MSPTSRTQGRPLPTASGLGTVSRLAGALLVQPHRVPGRTWVCVPVPAGGVGENRERRAGLRCDQDRARGPAVYSRSGVGPQAERGGGRLPGAPGLGSGAWLGQAPSVSPPDGTLVGNKRAPATGGLRDSPHAY